VKLICTHKEALRARASLQTFPQNPSYNSGVSLGKILGNFRFAGGLKLRFSKQKKVVLSLKIYLT